jgi:signal peptidase I
MSEMTVLGLLAAGVAVVVVVRGVAWVTRVASSSMAPTLQPADLVITRRLWRSQQIYRGDIVVLRSAELGRSLARCCYFRGARRFRRRSGSPRHRQALAQPLE